MGNQFLDLQLDQRGGVPPVPERRIPTERRNIKLPDKKSPSENAKTLALALAIIFIGAKDVVAPLIKNQNSGGKDQITAVVDVNSQRIARLEELAQSLRNVPQDLAALKESVTGVKVTMDKVERKLDTHMGMR